MSQDLLRGKALKAVAREIADGYAVLNPLVMKGFTAEAYKALYTHLRRVQTDVRMERFPSHDIELIRQRNMRLQRLHQAMMVLQNAAKVRKIVLA